MTLANIVALSLLSVTMLTANQLQAAEPTSLSPELLQQRVAQINELQNKSMLKTATAADLDLLYQQYSADFSYVHQVYGGTYSRQKLYNNHLNNLKAGRYQANTPRYRIVSMIAGFNAVAVQRQEVHQGVTSDHLSVFEFDGDKVSRIVEYWK